MVNMGELTKETIDFFLSLIGLMRLKNGKIALPSLKSSVLEHLKTKQKMKPRTT